MDNDTDRADAIRRDILQGIRLHCEGIGWTPDAVEKVQDLLSCDEPADTRAPDVADETDDVWRILDPDQQDNAEILADIMDAINDPTLWLEQDDPTEWRREGIAVAAATFELWHQQVSQ